MLYLGCFRRENNCIMYALDTVTEKLHEQVVTGTNIQPYVFEDLIKDYGDDVMFSRGSGCQWGRPRREHLELAFHRRKFRVSVPTGDVKLDVSNYLEGEQKGNIEIGIDTVIVATDNVANINETHRNCIYDAAIYDMVKQCGPESRMDEVFKNMLKQQYPDFEFISSNRSYWKGELLYNKNIDAVYAYMRFGPVSYFDALVRRGIKFEHLGKLNETTESI